MTNDARALGQRIYDAFNSRDFGAAETIFAPDFVSHALGTVGPDSVIRSWSSFHALFPDATVTVEDLLVDGDRVAVRTSIQGIPAELTDQAPPTMLEFFRVRDNRVTELWGLTSLTRANHANAPEGR
jgi:predicted SnoaL-like aldol condensation-catalyzing enzyme